jgi:hypothetical protein
MLLKSEKMTVEELSLELEREKIKIEELNLNKAKHRDAMFLALKKRPILMTKIKGANAEKILNYIVDTIPSSFIYLEKEQYTEVLAQKFLLYRLNELDKSTGRLEKTDYVTVQSSMDNKVLLNYTYVTQDGDEVYYFDNELQVPSSLKYSFKATLKIVNALALINKMDLHITQLGKNKIKSTLTDIFDNKFKAFISEYIKKNNAGYYSLCSNIDSVEEAFNNHVSKSFESYGIMLGEFIIKRFAIPKDIQNKIEDQCFRIRQQKADNDANNEVARKSIELYETKLAIDNKYPNGIHSLTEYEKDLALKRYLIKNGIEVNKNIERDIGIKDNKEKVDNTIDKKKDVVPEIPVKKNPARIAFFTTLFIALFIDFILFTTGRSSGAMICLGVIVLIFGLVGVLCYDKIKKPEIEVEEEITPIDIEITETENKD